MGGLTKRGPKHKKRKHKPYRDQASRLDKPLTEDDFKRMMEDAPIYRRGKGGAIHQVK